MASSAFEVSQQNVVEVDSSFGGVLEVLSVMQSEAWMFLLAALIYLLASGTAASALGWQTKGLSGVASASTLASSRRVAQRGGGSVATAAEDCRDGRQQQQQRQRRRQLSGADAERDLELFRDSVSKQSKSIRDLGKENNLIAAVAAFDSIKQDCVSSSKSMSALPYNSIIDACVQCRDLDMALRFFWRGEGAPACGFGHLQHCH